MSNSYFHITQTNTHRQKKKKEEKKDKGGKKTGVNNNDLVIVVVVDVSGLSISLLDLFGFLQPQGP